MKKIAVIFTTFMLLIGILSINSTYVYAAENEAMNTESSSSTNINENSESKAIDDETESKLVEIKDNAARSLEDYKVKYGSDAYGTVAYILNLVRIYSIPLCFLGIVIGVIHQYVIGIRKMDTLTKGMGLVVTFVTLLIICQILPLAFAVFVKFGRG